MKVVSFTALHYGTDYLEYALRSVIDHVDEAWIVYSPIGSHGFRTEKVCPDTRDELYAAAKRGAGDKLRWSEGTFAHEGEHRGMIHQLAPDADVIVVVDADEIYGEGVAKWCIQMAETVPFKTARLPFVHFWRSFYRCVLHDPAFPTRIVCPKQPVGDIVAYPECAQPHVNHMGYAQRPEIVEYKQHTHGHKGEWRRDCDWFQDRFMANAQTDCHPVGSTYWNPEPIDPWQYLPDFMRQHPYANMEVIE